MQQEKYYQASQVYGGIIATNPDNPLAWLGRANALLAAGDYVSAYIALEQGIQQFPRMLQFNFDLPALVGNREVLDVRRAEIERTLTANPDYQLRFLLGYLEYFSGLKDLGLKTLQQAADAAPQASVIHEAYRILVAQQSPASQPAK
jgi:tetratricopeptide (TPR) repeat protein